ncbi:MAG: hypothetical protein J3R72DRAFT_486767 [Linnemannia gamsii]|nr:MAG: hypothetical protein J3R72DRAFT_486767 [Linnemannia gamsii]
MESACERVFAIPELVHRLALQMTLDDLSRLMQTSHRLHSFSLSAFYRHMNCHTGPMLNSPDALHALARNTHHVRSLDSGRSFLVYYFNAVREFHQLASRALGLGYYGGQLSAFSCPDWVPPPDPRSCLLIPFPPMTHLTHLTVQIGLDYVHSGFEDEAFIERYETTNHVAQVSWILHLNPNLVQVCIFGISTRDVDALFSLAWAVSGLKKLEKLILEMIGKEDLWTLLSLSFWFICSPSIKGLGMLFEPSSDDEDDDEDEDDEELVKTLSADVKKITSWGLNRREGPMDNLELLTMEHLAYLPTKQICEFFKDCPSLVHLTLPSLDPSVDVVELGRSIGRNCAKLTGLINKVNADIRRQVLVFEILETMVVGPALEKFVSIGSFPVSDRMMAAFQRHSATLTWVQFDFNHTTESRFIQMVLFECSVLERVIIGGGGGDGEGLRTIPALELTVAEAVERKWASSRIKDLNLRISLGDIGVITDTTEPYYRRPVPIVLTEQEQQQFAVLEKFYKQLGRQTELEVLVLWRIEPVIVPNHAFLGDLTFPALLGLADPMTGRPGFLELLGGLKKLRSFRGSFDSYADENRAIIGMREVRWVAEAWPELKEAEFCPEPPYEDEELSPCLTWLQLQRPELFLS